jgi:Concanavalin A-like lectin/glucanases superfamily
MTISIVVLVPMLVLAIVGVFVFAGCSLVAPLDEHESRQPYPVMILEAIGLRNYWRLGDAPLSQAIDEEKASPVNGDYHDGVSTDAGVLSLTQDPLDKATAFDGTSGRVEMQNDPVIVPPLGFTVEAWIRPGNVTQRGAVVVGSYETQPPRGFQLRVHRTATGGLKAQMWLADGKSNTFQKVIGDIVDNTHDNWHHLVATFNPSDPQGLMLYVDGDLRDAATVGKYAQVGPGAPFRIGAGRDEASPSLTSPDLFFSGRIDEVAVYGIALLPNIVRDHFIAGTTP